MDRKDLEAKTKPELLQLGASLGFNLTPASTKAELVTALLGATPPAAAAPAVPPPPAPTVLAKLTGANEADALAAANARIAELEGKIKEADTRAETAAEIARASANSTIIADKPTDAPLPQEGQLRTLDGGLVSMGKVRIKIDQTETDKEDVIVSLNGHALRIKRGHEVDIPAPYLGVLRDAKITTREYSPDTGKWSDIEMQRYPYTAEKL